MAHHPTMSTESSRRSFLKQAGVASAAAAASTFGTAPGASAAPAMAAPGGSPKKAVLIGMLPKDLPYQERFALAREVGFEGMEVNTVENPADAEAIAKAAQAARLPIHSVMNSEHWRSPLSSADPAVVDKSVKGMLTSIANAKLFGADTVLLVPAVVDAKTGYKDAWDRSHKVIRERILPEAEKQGIVIAIEEVWNKFLLSPLEMNAFVDSFNSKWVQAYFDVGNIVFYAYPQDWIRTLGPAHQEGAPEGLQARAEQGHVQLGAPGRGQHRLAGSAQGAARHRLRRLRDDRDQGRRQGLPDRCRRAPRPVPRRPAARAGRRAIGLTRLSHARCRFARSTGHPGAPGVVVFGGIARSATAGTADPAAQGVSDGS